ncbi:hypothetical protein HYU09_00300 [Candidatus Woesearchaeota archaeon]|nr:hypothetical protein [Candidatus Woesearchaeota archaeon]
MVPTASEAENQPTIDNLLAGRIDLPGIRERLSDPNIADSVFSEVKKRAKKGYKLGQQALPYGYSRGKEIILSAYDQANIKFRYMAGWFSDAVGIVRLSPDVNSGEKTDSIYLKRDFFRFKEDYPWVEFYVPHPASLGERKISLT